MIPFYNMEISTQAQANGGFSMKDLMARVEFDLPKVGTVVSGEIISASKNSVMVDLGSLGTGIVYPGEFYDNPNLQKSLKAGQHISAVLLDIENEDGYRELSLKQAQMTTAWQDIRTKKESGELITTKVININKGGLIVEINGVQGFLPLSQLAPEHYPKVEGGDTTKIVQQLQKLRNQDIRIKIIDFSEEEGRLIVSEKAISDGQLKEEIAKLKVGDVVEAEITDVTDFGAFAAIILADSDELTAAGVDEDSEPAPLSAQPELLPAESTEPVESIDVVRPRARVEGLIHISEIDWKLIDNPRDILHSGDHVQAKIVSIDGTKVSLSLKTLKPDPWIGIEAKYKVGQSLEGEVAKINNYGIMVKLEEEISGFLPASELGDKRPSELYAIGDKLSVSIVTIEPAEHKMTLTLQDGATAMSTDSKEISGEVAKNSESNEKQKSH